MPRIAGAQQGRPRRRQGEAAGARRRARPRGCRSTRLHDLGARRRRRRRPQALSRRHACRRAPGTIRRTTSPTSPMRMLAAEITREKIYRPPARRAALRDRPSRRRAGRSCKDGSVRIEQTIFVERDSQKSIVLGKGGADHQEDLDGSARASWPRSSSARCICSCSSRCARTGRTIPSATARWASSSRRSSFPRRAIPDGTRPPPHSALSSAPA